MEEREYQSLVDKYGEKATEKLIELLDNYKGSSGKTYKSDYRAILNWVVDKAQKEYPKLFTAQKTRRMTEEIRLTNRRRYETDRFDT